MPGMDACFVYRSADGFMISGTAVYKAENEPAQLDYCVICDSNWNSLSAEVVGRIGAAEKSLALKRSAAGHWTLQGEKLSGMGGLLDIDLGFTPATNTNAIRRLGLEIGASVETTALWLDTEDWRLKPLKQAYRRRSETVYTYSSPSHDYHADLIVDDFGLIRLYPQLWQSNS